MLTNFDVCMAPSTLRILSLEHICTANPTPEGNVYTLGINAAYHDCSATLVCDGEVIAAAEEERFTRIKHGKRPVPFSTWQLPFHAID